MTDDPRERLRTFLRAVMALPAKPTVSFRGLRPEDPFPQQAIVTTLITAATRHIELAADAFRTTRLVAIAGVTGRDISALSSDQDAGEITFLPTTMLVPQRMIHAGGLDVVLLEEFVEVDGEVKPPGWDMSILVPTIENHLATAKDGFPTPPSDLGDLEWGRFVGPIE